MKVLLTGAFGNIGVSTIHELLKQGHQVRCFDVDTPANRKTARKVNKQISDKHYPGRVQIVWGDLRHLEDVVPAARDQEAVIHLAFVIPSLSTTGTGSESEPEWARIINVGGTRNLITVLREQPRPPRLLFASSLHIYGRTHDQPPPRTVDDLPQPIEHYAHHKVTCERLVRSSGLEWTIFRLGAALPIRLVLDPDMFNVPLNNRIEFVHTRDVGLAFSNGLETDAVWGRVWHIGGGANCQLYQREILEGVLDAVGIGMLPEEAFTEVPFPTDWLDTAESQKVLNFQRFTLQEYIQDVKGLLGIRRPFIQLFRPFIRSWLLKQSPILAANNS